jgi:predicted pyridoxine 5'-phosphate oxidase superfamily flavin-nucleotide-binding protein
MFEYIPAIDGWPAADSPFHPGELAMQERLGVREKMDRMGRRFIRDYMPAQHRDFYQQLPFMFTGLVDDDGQPWASILLGRPGFVQSPYARQLTITARPLPGDPSASALRNDADIGLLGIELATRRRNRVNGIIKHASEGGFDMMVTQSFGNCPQYIQTREFIYLTDPANAIAVEPVHNGALDERSRAIIERADTFFIASANQERSAGAAKGADVSHRGGRTGFVRIDDDSTLTTPDFIGNFMFNTLGNLTLNPRAGLLFIDFEQGDMLYIAVRVEIIWDGRELAAFAGAERLLQFHIEKIIRLDAVLAIRWSAPAFAGQIAHTGSWSDVALAAQAPPSRHP